MQTVITYQINTAGSVGHKQVTRCAEHAPERYTSISHGAHGGLCPVCDESGAEYRLRGVDLRGPEIRIPAKRYEDHDGCLRAAEADVCEVARLKPWQVEARWADEQRDEIVVEVAS